MWATRMWEGWASDCSSWKHPEPECMGVWPLSGKKQSTELSGRIIYMYTHTHTHTHTHIYIYIYYIYLLLKKSDSEESVILRNSWLSIVSLCSWGILSLQWKIQVLTAFPLLRMKKKKKKTTNNRPSHIPPLWHSHEWSQTGGKDLTHPLWIPLYVYTFNQPSELKFRVSSSVRMRAGLISCYLHPSSPSPLPLPTSHGLSGQGTPWVSMPIPLPTGLKILQEEKTCTLWRKILITVIKANNRKWQAWWTEAPGLVPMDPDHCNLGLSLGKTVPTCSVSLLGRQKVTSLGNGMDPFWEKLWHEISTSIHHLFFSCPSHLTSQHCPACFWLLMIFSFLWPVSWLFSHHRCCLFQKHWH